MIQYCVNHNFSQKQNNINIFTPQDMARAKRFCESMGAAPTPLLSMRGQARKAGLGALLLKDESAFMNLQSFKARGSIWALANILARQAGLQPGNFTDAELRGALLRHKAKTFVSATDGNHGRGLAWAARHFGQKAQIFMPRGAAPQRIAAITALGAQCLELDMNYDETVRYARDYAGRMGFELVQDTAWEGYEDIPALIMQGYAAVAGELCRQLDEMGENFWPDHIFIQAGVGSLAAAFIAGYCLEMAERGRKRPVFASMEPENAACLYESIQNGQRTGIGGSLSTIMAGLSCGEVSSLAWPILRDNLAGCFKARDAVAALGMKSLAWPEGGDSQVIAGESGAIGPGILQMLNSADGREARHKLGLKPDSVALCISTEGATDRASWESITGCRLERQ